MPAATTRRRNGAAVQFIRDRADGGDAGGAKLFNVRSHRCGECFCVFTMLLGERGTMAAELLGRPQQFRGGN